MGQCGSCEGEPFEREAALALLLQEFRDSNDVPAHTGWVAEVHPGWFWTRLEPVEDPDLVVFQHGAFIACHRAMTALVGPYLHRVFRLIDSPTTWWTNPSFKRRHWDLDQRHELATALLRAWYRLNYQPPPSVDAGVRQVGPDSPPPFARLIWIDALPGTPVLVRAMLTVLAELGCHESVCTRSFWEASPRVVPTLEKDPFEARVTTTAHYIVSSPLADNCGPVHFWSGPHELADYFLYAQRLLHTTFRMDFHKRWLLVRNLPPHHLNLPVQQPHYEDGTLSPSAASPIPSILPLWFALVLLSCIHEPAAVVHVPAAACFELPASDRRRDWVRRVMSLSDPDDLGLWLDARCAFLPGGLYGAMDPNEGMSCRQWFARSAFDVDDQVRAETTYNWFCSEFRLRKQYHIFYSQSRDALFRQFLPAPVDQVTTLVKTYLVRPTPPPPPITPHAPAPTV
jgi:hypothetical protein